jgi:hypothetical protein
LPVVELAYLALFHRASSVSSAVATGAANESFEAFESFVSMSLQELRHANFTELRCRRQLAKRPSDELPHGDRRLRGCLHRTLVHDERKETARDEHVGTATPARGSHVGGIGARQDTRIAAGFVAAVATQVAAH